MMKFHNSLKFDRNYEMDEMHFYLFTIILYEYQNQQVEIKNWFLQSSPWTSVSIWIGYKQRIIVSYWEKCIRHQKLWQFTVAWHDLKRFKWKTENKCERIHTKYANVIKFLSYILRIRILLLRKYDETNLKDNCTCSHIFLLSK